MMTRRVTVSVSCALTTGQALFLGINSFSPHQSPPNAVDFLIAPGGREVGHDLSRDSDWEVRSQECVCGRCSRQSQDITSIFFQRNHPLWSQTQASVFASISIWPQAFKHAISSPREGSRAEAAVPGLHAVQTSGRGKLASLSAFSDSRASSHFWSNVAAGCSSRGKNNRNNLALGGLMVGRQA